MIKLLKIKMKEILSVKLKEELLRLNLKVQIKELNLKEKTPELLMVEKIILQKNNLKHLKIQNV